MARIFLSYARDDPAKAERIAHLSELAGNSVWWDRQLHAGSRFTAEIDEALANADAIVVLWSRQSVDSAWVQDEAAVGRDSGRLYPVLLESISPPLGFRQYQTADLSGWSGRGKPRNLVALLKAIDRNPAPKVPPERTAMKRPFLPRRPALFGGVAALVLIAFGTAWLLVGSRQAPAVWLTASSSGDVTESRNFARQVAVDLAQFHPAVLQSLNIVDESQPDPGARFHGEIGLNESGNASHADISLLVKGRPGVSWAEGMDGQASRPADLRQRAASALTTVLGCALKADQSSSKLGISAYRQFLEGCSAVESDYSSISPGDVVAMLKQVTRSAPDFAPAFGMLAFAEFNRAPASGLDQARLQDAHEALKRAKQLDASSEEAIAADAVLHPSDKDQWSRALPILDRGLELHPDSGLLLDLKAEYLMSVGRMNEASAFARQALGFEPLSARSQEKLVSSLAYSNRIPAAYDELAKAEAIWPDSGILENDRYSLDLRYGDPRQALAQMKTMGANETDRAALDESWVKFLMARMNPSQASIDAALQSFRHRYRRDRADVPGYLQALGTFGRTDEAFEITANPTSIEGLEPATDVLFRPHMRSLMADPRFIGLADKLGLLAFWRKSGIWPDFCHDPELPYDCKKEAARYPA